MSRVIAVDSPPGMLNPSRSSSCSAVHTSTASAPSRRSTATCSRKFPWTARTPIRMPALPAQSLEQLFRRARRGGETAHGLAEPTRHPRENLGVVEVRGRLDDRLRARHRALGLEDAGADEDTVCAELHAERGI